MEKGRITLRQFTILGIVFTIGTSILTVPSPLVIEAQQDAWLAAILGTCFSLLLLVIYKHLSNYHPNETLVDFLPKLLGKWAGLAIAILYFFFHFLLTGYFLRIVGFFIGSMIMPETPSEVVIMLFALVIIIAVRYGLEPIVRVTELFFPWILFFLIFLVSALLPQIDVQKLLPIYENGFKPIFRGSLMFFISQDFSIMLMLYSFVNRPKEAFERMFWGAMIGSLVLVSITFLSVSVLGVDFSIRNMYPSFVLVKKISIGGFLDRVEVLLAGVWFLGVFVKTATIFYVCVITLAQVVKLRTYKPIVLPLGAIVTVISIFIYPNITENIHVFPRIWISVALLYMLIVPASLLIISKWKHAKAKT